MIEDLHSEMVMALPPNEPVTMLNLIKFREASLDGNGSGWDAYQRYVEAAVDGLKSRGAKIVWAGQVRGVPLGPANFGNWDFAALVWYPTPGAFLEMMQSPDYEQANRHRVNGCERHLILANETMFSRGSDC